MGAFDPIQVTVDQFYGIEINDFAVEVAKTALWIAELQMFDEMQQVLSMWIGLLPLKTNGNIHEGNALKLNWNDVLPASQCTYVIGNPSFISNMTKAQVAEAKAITGTGALDYVAFWYYRFIEYAKGTDVLAAFVSTNSICQGEQPVHLWKAVFDAGHQISFAHQTFNCTSEVTNRAHVHVVIVGIAPNTHRIQKRFFRYPDINGAATESIVSNINDYLYPFEIFFVTSRPKPLCDVLVSKKGSSPTDDGNLIINSKYECDEILRETPSMSSCIRNYYDAEEFLNNIDRWCL